MRAPATASDTSALALDLAQAERFLRVVFGEVPGPLDLRFIDEDGAVIHRFAPDIDSALCLIEAHGEGRNVYVGLATRRDESSGKKHNLLATRVLWADLDPKQEGDREAFEVALERFPYPPSLRVWSGGGLHVYWLLEEPFSLIDMMAVTRFEMTLKGIADVLGGDQNATDASRILRVPGTVNYPDPTKRARGRGPARCELLEVRPLMYAFEDFADLFEERGRLLRGNGAAHDGATYAGAEWNGELPEAVREVLERCRAARARWGGDASGLRDESDSGLDLAVANLLALELLRRGHGHGEVSQLVEAALRYRRAESGAREKHAGYYRQTVERALAWAEGESKRADEDTLRQAALPATEPATPSEACDPASYFDSAGLIVPKLGSQVRTEGHVRLGIDGRLYRYQAGVYRADGEAFVRVRVRELLGARFRRRHVDEVLAFVRADYPSVGERHPENLLNVHNGLLRWRTGALELHSPEVISTAQLAVSWRPEARCPRIDAFLAEVVPADAVDFVREVMGYALLGRNVLRVAVLLLGPGANGKSVLLALLRGLLGEGNVSAVSLQALAESRFAAAELFGKLANICGDLDARAIRQTDTFKAWTGGDPISAERKHRDPFTFAPSALPVFSANEPPLSSDQSEGWFDRWVIVPMETRISEERRDPYLVAKLTVPGELEGLLVQAVAGLHRVMERGRFDPPASVRAAGIGYRDRLDSVRGFIAEACTLEPAAWTPRPLLYRAYRAWATESGRLPVSAATCHDHVRRGYAGQVEERTREGIRGWAGLNLLEAYRPADEPRQGWRRA